MLKMERNVQTECSVEREFLAAILYQAKKDLSSHYDKHIRDESIAFFQNAYGTLEWLCGLLDIDYMTVQERIIAEHPQVEDDFYAMKRSVPRGYRGNK